MSNKDNLLSQPIKIGTRTAKNRFAINAMECCDAAEGGGFSERALERYQNLYEGGAGFIDFESITMQYDSRARDMQLALRPDDKENMAQWAKCSDGVFSGAAGRCFYNLRNGG